MLFFAVFLALANTTQQEPLDCGHVVPKAGPPLAQAKRPPQQTAEQYRVQQLNIQDSKTKSAAARSWLSTEVQTTAFRQKIANLPCVNTSTDDIIGMLSWEFKRLLPILRNGPLNPGGGSIPDDSDLLGLDDVRAGGARIRRPGPSASLKLCRWRWRWRS